MKYLITGISGFVGAHLVRALHSGGHQIAGIDQHEPATLKGEITFHQCSLMDYESLRQVISAVSPDRIIHLASASSVALSWERPGECFVNNTNIFLNLVEAVRTVKLKCRILSVGSSEEYGPVTAQDIPLEESRPADPMNPYAVARVAQEHLSRVYARGYGMDIVCTRSFNHLGPGQTDRFVVSSFARQAVEVRLGRRQQIVCGDPSIIRDLIDVRDVIAAYELILERGISGEIYNVCTGKGISLSDLLAAVCRKAGIPARWMIDPKLIRPIDNPVIIGSCRKLAALGFAPGYDLDRSLDDLVGWWKEHV